METCEDLLAPPAATITTPTTAATFSGKDQGRALAHHGGIYGR